ncbi:MAG: helix-turn-helix transcriptional regulator [Paracoccaceae bacterium]
MLSLPNSTEAKLAAVITAIGTDDFAPRLYDWLGRCFEIDNCTVVAFYQTGQPEVLFSKSNVKQVHDRMEIDYLSGVYQLDPFHDLHVNAEPNGLYRLKDCAPDHFQRNEYFAKYFKQTTLIDEACYHVAFDQGISVQICLGRDISSNRTFSARDLRTAEKLSAIACSLIAQQWKDLKSKGIPSTASLISHLKKQLSEHRGIQLSQRQCEVALLILRGHSTISIGLRLGISPQTVKVFRKQLYRRCSISSQAELFSLMSEYLAR